MRKTLLIFISVLVGAVVFCAAATLIGFFFSCGIELATVIGGRVGRVFEWRDVLGPTFLFGWIGLGVGSVAGLAFGCTEDP